MKRENLRFLFTPNNRLPGLFSSHSSTSLCRPIPFLLSILICFCFENTQAQLTLNSNATPQQLVQTIVGAGYNVSNVAMHCPGGAIGTFVSNGSNIGLTSGILLTTGQVSIANGPNNSPNSGFNNGAAGDFDLSNLAGTATYDGCALEFDIIPACDSLKIDYVFGSEEYPEYVNKQFNDVFAFFISGPGFVGLQNIALVPGTAQPVSINNINSGKNAQYYIDNTGGATIQYDGFTTPLQARAKVTPCGLYHLKLVIADVLDGIFDSGVFIKGNSIQCSPITYNDVASNTNAVKDCASGSFTFCRTGDTTLPYTVKYTTGGTAVKGVDYQTLSDSVVIPANQKCVTTNVVTLPTRSGPGTKTVQIIYQYGSCPRQDTITLQITDPNPLNAGPDVSLCSGDTVSMGPLPSPNVNYTWTPTTGLSNPNISNPKVTLINKGNADTPIQYVLTATSAQMGSCVLKDSIIVTVKPLPEAQFNAKTDYCIGTTASFTDASIPTQGKTITGWYWNFGNNLFDNIQNPSIKYTVAGTYTVDLKVTDNASCKDDTTLVIHIWPLPIANFSLISACQGDSVKFQSTSSVPGGGTIQQSIWNFGDASPLISGSNPIHLYSLAQNSYTVQLIVTSDKNCVNNAQEVVNINPKPTAAFNLLPANICIYDLVKTANLSSGDNSFWNFGDGATASTRNPTHKYALPGPYKIQLISTTSFGCSDTITKTITIYDLPKFDFTATDTAGCPFFCTTFNGSAIAGSDPITNWHWLFNTGDASDGPSVTYCYQKNGQYSPSLVATSSHGCVDTVSKPFYIDVYPKPKPAFTVNPNQISIFQPTVVITDQSSTDVNHWVWNFGDTKTDSGAGPFTHKYTIDSDQYTVFLTVKNKYGCTDTISLRIGVKSESTVYVSNAFTPNDDGINDHFRPYCSGDYATADFEMDIYDRWGNLILKTNDLNYGWDGTLNGTTCQQDVYVYEIYFTYKSDGSILKKLRGIVSLLK